MELGDEEAHNERGAMKIERERAKEREIEINTERDIYMVDIE